MSTDLLERIKPVLSSISREDYEKTEADKLLKLDSIQRISLIAALEEEFNLEIDSEELEPEVFDTFNSIATFIRKIITA